MDLLLKIPRLPLSLSIPAVVRGGLIARCVIASWLLVHYRESRQKPFCTLCWVTMTLSCKQTSPPLPQPLTHQPSHHHHQLILYRPTNSLQTRTKTAPFQEMPRCSSWILILARQIYLFWVFWKTALASRSCGKGRGDSIGISLMSILSIHHSYTLTLASGISSARWIIPGNLVFTSQIFPWFKVLSNGTEVLVEIKSESAKG